MSRTASIALTDSPLAQLDLAELPVRSPGVQNRAFRDFEVDVAHDIADGFAGRNPEMAAKHGLARWQKIAGIVVAVAIILGVVLVPVLLMQALMSIGTVIAVVEIVLVLAGLWYYSRWGRSRKVPARLADDELPTYTILVPAYQEQEVIGDLVRSLADLDYPTDRLEVLLLVERRDMATKQAINDASPPAHMRIVELPPGLPQTKPRSCNAGLLLASGDLLVIFDAEDRPERDQLRRAAEMFAAPDSDDLACVQATLLQSNGPTNAFTATNGLEYARRYRFVVPGLVTMGSAFPLGGTSNHFRTSVLREVGGWDAWNVTEDADLGMRCRAFGYRTDIVEPITWGEAPDTFHNWLCQRTRWHKGHLMTTLVHTRQPLKSLKRFGPLSMLALIVYVLGSPLNFLLQPIVIGLGLSSFMGYEGFLGHRLASELSVHPFVYGAVQMAVYLVSLLISFMVCPRPRHRYLGAMFISPFLNAIAAWRALWQLITAPFQWEKTAHGTQSASVDVR